MILQFGKHKGKDITDVPTSYIIWLATHEPDESLRFRVPSDVQAEAKRLLEQREYAKNRYRGMPADKTEYVVELLGDIIQPVNSGTAQVWEDDFENYAVFDSMDEAITFIVGLVNRPAPDGDTSLGDLSMPDPEDDRIVVWEVMPSGHRKALWHFSGWHYDAEEFYGLEQGQLPGHEASLYSEALTYYELA